MNKRQKEKNKQVKQITYQEAWNKIAEFMNNYPSLTFLVDPWSDETSFKRRYSLQTIENGKCINHFIADKEWSK